MPRKERTFSIRTAMLILIVGSGILAIAAALLVGWFSYREYRDRIGSSLIAASRAIMVSVDGELDQALAFVNGLSTSPNDVFQKVLIAQHLPRDWSPVILDADSGVVHPCEHDPQRNRQGFVAR